MPVMRSTPGRALPSCSLILTIADRRRPGTSEVPPFNEVHGKCALYKRPRRDRIKERFWRRGEGVEPPRAKTSVKSRQNRNQQAKIWSVSWHFGGTSKGGRSFSQDGLTRYASSFPEIKSASRFRTRVERARLILSCAAGACDEVPREERGAWLRGAAPPSATSP
jgi:hypothetical protein